MSKMVQMNSLKKQFIYNKGKIKQFSYHHSNATKPQRGEKYIYFLHIQLEPLTMEKATADEVLK